MGKLILCTGREASHPFTFSSVEKSASTMEELCYLIYHNAFDIQEELYTEELMQFIGVECGLTERAEYLRGLIESHAGAKDLIVAIFCSTDYFDEGEILRFLSSYDAFYKLGPTERKKREADRLLSQEKWREAARLYQEILDGDGAASLSDRELGNLLHNFAVIEARDGLLKRAQERFREAYLRNQDDETLKQYLLSLKLGGQDELFEEELRHYMPRQQLLEELTQEMYRVRTAAEQTREYQQFEELRNLQAQGRIMEYYQGTDTLLEELKQQYRSARNKNRAG